MNSLVVFSHLRWNFVVQRPQHVVSRLARKWRVLFVEEPRFHTGDPRAELRSPCPGVTVLTPHTPLTAPGFHDDQIPLLSKFVAHAIAREQLDDYGAWFYTPMALPLLMKLSPRFIVYDCVDNLAAFRGAPRQLVQRENALLRTANVVFCSGAGLFEARRQRHWNIHHVPSSVDREHFVHGADPSHAHPDIKALARPRLGMFGVIDDRVDLALLRTMAQARPEWEICLVGPVARIDPATLPQAPNIHYFGQRPYSELPAFVAGWDVALVPFAQNDAARFLNPTKTLEYMAAERPIVSTPINDIARAYGNVIRFGQSPDAFIEACDAALVEPADEREARIARMRSIVASTSWDETVCEMRRIIDASSRGGLTEAARIMFEPAPSSSIPTTIRSGAPCLILGGGPTGLSAAHHYGEGSVVLERESKVGGSCRSFEDTGFTFDHAGHVMFSNDPYVQDLYRLLLGDNVHWQEREAWAHCEGAFVRHPFQKRPYGLGSRESRAIDARSPSPGTRSNHREDRSAAHRRYGALGNDDPPAAAKPPTDPRNFEEFIHGTWDAGIAQQFALPYNRKLWTVPLSDMETSWVGGHVPLPDLEETIEGGLSPAAKSIGPDARFGYPLRGGFQALMNGFLPLLRGDLMLNADVEGVSPLMRVVTLKDGRRFHYDTLISTLPLPLLIAAIGDEAPADVRRAARELRHVSVRCVNLGVARSHVTDKHWIYFPGETVFHRVFMQGNASPHCNARGGFGITCEITYSATKPLPETGAALTERCFRELVEVGLLDASDGLITSNQVDIPYAYVIYDHARKERVARIRDWLEQFDILLAGRYGEWEYYNCDHAFIAGKKAAEKAQRISATRVAVKSA